MNKGKQLLLTGCLVLFGLGQPLAQEIPAASRDSGSPPAPYVVPSGLSADEKYWFVKFQEGNMLVDGWQEIATEVLAKIPSAKQGRQRDLLVTLGTKIGLEWCKDNDIRKVDNSMLQSWGKQLKQTAKKDPARLEVVLVAINEKVDALLK
ncbi:hypothetical protein [Desulfogranum mediterraneum]|uniref:hypothetical protein n=1 Tax=Desulfogranum mediterraneum TaxID=160661 RepID=UPI00129465FD|nr:hypothetical protein [Desulfogranum mediterraneum]